eukprot:3832674-Prymnesium_polylepis.2
MSGAPIADPSPNDVSAMPAASPLRSGNLRRARVRSPIWCGTPRLKLAAHGAAREHAGSSARASPLEAGGTRRGTGARGLQRTSIATGER